MRADSGRLSEGGEVTNIINLRSQDEDRIKSARQLGIPVWIGVGEVKKYNGDWTAEEIDAGLAGNPYEIVNTGPNLLVYGGASCLWECLVGNGTASAGQALTYFNNAQAAIGTGDSSTAAAATQTDLQAASGATHQFRQPMDSTYPQHTDGVVVGAASIVFRATFGSGDGNYTSGWQEWGVFNSSTAATGRMLQRKVQSLGTKVSGATWQFTVTLTLS